MGGKGDCRFAKEKKTLIKMEEKIIKTLKGFNNCNVQNCISLQPQHLLNVLYEKTLT